MNEAQRRYDEARQRAGLLRAWSAKPVAGIRELLTDLAAAEKEERAAKLELDAQNQYEEAKKTAATMRALIAKPCDEILADFAAAEEKERAALQALQAARNDSRQIDG